MVQRVVVDQGVHVPMRDGTPLAADLYLPDSKGPFPALVQRTPYGRQDPFFVNLHCDVMRAARGGYAVLVEDTRGRWGSGGRFTPFATEKDDGVDTVEWVARQPWCTGKVGMVGGSYVGATQWLAAAGNPPGLEAIVPVETASDFYEGWTYQGGAFQLGLALYWTLASLMPDTMIREAAAQRELRELTTVVDDIAEGYGRHPELALETMQKVAPYYSDWLTHHDYDDYWRCLAPRTYHPRVTVPALNVGGWYDCFLGGTLANYTGMRTDGGSETARRGQRLIVGPWSHGVLTGFYPWARFGLASSADEVDLNALYIRWFDHWLKGEPNGVAEEAPVRIFVMGTNQWRQEQDWPLPDTRWTNLFLHSNGRARSATGDGRLMEEEPYDEPCDSYLYDPADPVPTVGGQSLLPGPLVAANAGPMDQQEVERRVDVLCYTTSPLDRAVEVTGPIRAIFHVASSAVDTDFTAKLVDVHPDGRALILTDGILRAKYRNSLSEPMLLQPGKTEQIEIDMWATSNVFLAGHSIRLEVSSSSFPRFDANPNTGRFPGEAPLVPALNSVFHDRMHASRLVLPVIDRGA